jgi:DNA helicase-2/ATP-dependent DNA helicase PcrA
MPTKGLNESLLNPDQRDAVEHTTGPLLIVAGAGTGKTTVITERVKWLIGTGLAKTDEILALTFTEKAAKEMADRIDTVLPYGTFGLWVSTFHSFCDRILRAEALQIGLSPNFHLMTEVETYQLIKDNFWKFPLDYFRPTGNPYKFIQGLVAHFSRLKDEDISCEEYLDFAKKLSTTAKTEEEIEESKRITELAVCCQAYEQLKAEEESMDFSDLISNVLKLFRTRKSVTARYKKQFKFILVDEFQDTNLAQYHLVKLLAPPEENPNITVVGDDSQSIYKFRGAAISNILSFMDDYKKAKQVVLTINYRSTKTILDAAYALIKKNDPYTLESQLGISKNLVPAKKQKEHLVRVFHCQRVEDEAEEIVKAIKDLQKKDGLELRDFAILLRANSHSEPFVKALERAGLPSQFLGPGILFHQEKIKDLIAYLKLLNDFTDSLSLYRVLSMDLWHLSQRDLVICTSESKKQNVSLFEILEKVSEVLGVSEEGTEIIQNFVTMVHSHLELIPKETAGQILFHFLEESGLFKKIIDYDSIQGEEDAKNIMKFFDRLKTFESTHRDAGVRAVTDYLELATSLGESPLAAQIDWSENNAVNLLTVHSAKGLEFPVVFLVNLVEGRFPSRDRSETIPLPTELIKEILPEGDYHLQEERRLFYVAMTRAKSHLFFSASNFYGDGKRERKISPFVPEALGADFTFQKTAEKPLEKQLPLIEWRKPNISSERRGETLAYKVDFLSYSSIDTFKLCPLHYKIRNILRIPAPMTAAQSMGNSVHLALKEFCQMKIDGQLIGVSQKEKTETILNLLQQVWSHEGFEGKVHEKESRDKAERFLTQYLESDLEISGKPFLVEKPFSFYPNKTLKVIGKIDRVDDLGDGRIEIIDYKTGKPPTKSELNKDLQMDIYALAAVDPGILNRKINEVLLTFFYFESNSKLTTTRTAADLDSARKEILEIRDQIEASDFSCSRNRFCESCEYKILCNS